MKEQNRDNLENFFRQGAQNHNLEFNETDWLSLKNQLDKEMPVGFTLIQFLKKYWIGVFMLLLLPMAWIGYEHISVKQNISSETASNHQDKDFTEISAKTSEITGPSKKTSQTIESNSSSEFKVNESEEAKSNIVEETLSEIIAGTQTGYENSDNSDQAKLGQVVLEEGVDADGQIVNRQLLFLSPISPDYKIEGSIQEINEVEERSEIFPIRESASFFKLGIGYSPDFSTVGIGNFVSPGSRWTATIEYGFLKRFVISTGVVLVNNKYEAYGEEYHAPSRYWRNGIVAEEAYGECNMIDIPLNLRYNFIQTGKNRVFVSAGASTYFVTKEDYYFHYEQDDPDLPQHWGTDKTTIYPFEIINLSLGYEYEFSRRSGLQIEPFIKIPTTGIGWGNVDLHTMGIYFMYKYKL